MDELSYPESVTLTSEEYGTIYTAVETMAKERDEARELARKLRDPYADINDLPKDHWLFNE